MWDVNVNESLSYSFFRSDEGGAGPDGGSPAIDISVASFDGDITVANEGIPGTDDGAAGTHVGVAGLHNDVVFGDVGVAGLDDGVVIGNSDMAGQDGGAAGFDDAGDDIGEVVLVSAGGGDAAGD